MCVGNSGRSIVAEAIAKRLFGNKAEVQSAGSQPSKVNPLALMCLQEIAIDGKDLYSKFVSDLNPAFVDSLDYVITLCAEEVCPIIISKAKKLHWPLPDAANLPGTEVERLQSFRAVREELKLKIERLGKDLGIIGRQRSEYDDVG